MELLEFTDGCSVVNLVGKKSAFKNKEDFFDACINEFDYILQKKVADFEKFKSNKDLSLVYDEIYCRFYPKMPEDSGVDFESGYAFCQKKKGTFEVYVMNMDELVGL